MVEVDGPGIINNNNNLFSLVYLCSRKSHCHIKFVIFQPYKRGSP